MLPLVEFPELVQRYAPFFVDVFSEAALLNLNATSAG